LLGDVLQHIWPSHIPTLSVAKKVLRRRRVWSISLDGKVVQPQLNRELPQDAEVAFFPDYPRRQAYDEMLPVAYEDDAVAVVVKPFGMRTHGGIRTVANCLTTSLRASDADDAVPAFVAMNIIPEDVSGLVLVAKTASAGFSMASSLPQLSVVAVVSGKMPAAHKVIPSLRFGHISEVAVETSDAGALRAEWAKQGHPVIGDTAYGGENAPIARAGRVFMCVVGLSFMHPGSRKLINVSADSQRSRLDKLVANEAFVFENAWKPDSQQHVSDYVRQLRDAWEQKHGEHEFPRS